MLGAAPRGPWHHAPTCWSRAPMKRHDQTAAGVCEGAGLGLPSETDDGWNEFDHLQVLAVHDPAPEGVDMSRPTAAFQRWFEEATLRWTSGGSDERLRRVVRRLHRARRARRSSRPCGALNRKGTAVVFTSGGPIAWAAATRLGGARADLWLRLNQVPINAAVTSFVIGSRGTTLLAFNEHDAPLPRPPYLPIGHPHAHHPDHRRLLAASAPRWRASSPPSATTWRCARGVRTGSTTLAPQIARPTRTCACRGQGARRQRPRRRLPGLRRVPRGARHARQDRRQRRPRQGPAARHRPLRRQPRDRADQLHRRARADRGGRAASSASRTPASW